MLPYKKKRITGFVSVAILIVFTAVVGYFIGIPMVRFAGEPEQFRAWVESRGIFASLVFVGMVLLQILVAIIPGEPLELGAGYAFGVAQGTILCLIGIAIGSAIVFLLARKFGMMLLECFFSRRQIQSFSFLHTSPRRDLVVFLVMLIPGTPKDLLSYLAGLTDLKLWKWVIIATVARIPSVVTSVVSGSLLGEKNYAFAAILFVVTGVLSYGGYLLYKRRVNREQ